VHSTIFGRNNLAMACGLAVLEVIDDEKLGENFARMGGLLMEKVDALRAKHSFIKEVRGKGLMIGIEFHEPHEFKLKMAWKLLHKIDKVLFAQMIVTQMLSQRRKCQGPMWEIGNTFVKAALGSRRTAEARPAVSA